MSPAPAGPAPDLGCVFSWIEEQFGTAINAARRGEVERQLRILMRQSQTQDAEHFCALVEQESKIFDALARVVTVNESYFFRHRQHFEFARTQLGDLLLRGGDARPARIWSACCASGEEPYSMAIVLEELGFSQDTKILATDISRSALARAQRARYRPWALRSLDASLRQRHFRSVDPGDGQGEPEYQLRTSLRERVYFDYFNLVVDRFPNLERGIWAMDLILCRNVLIYLQPARIEDLWVCFRDSLAPGGWLLLGPSDPLPQNTDGFEVVTQDWGLCLRRTEQGGAPRRKPVDSASAAQPGSAARPGADVALAQGRPGPARLSPPKGRPPAQPEADAPPSTTQQQQLSAARRAFAAGQHETVLSLLGGGEEDDGAPGEEGFDLLIRALAPRDARRAAAASARAAATHPLSPRLWHLHALCLFALAQHEEAAEAARRALYLDATLPAAHFLLGRIERARGQIHSARRAYENARRQCAKLPPDSPILLCEDTRASQLASAAEVALMLLGNEEVLS